MRVRIGSIRFRVAAIAATVALTAILAAAAVVWSLSLAEDRIAGTLASQRRLDLWSTVSARISDYTFVALDTAERRDAGRGRMDQTRTSVLEAFATIEKAVTDSITDAPSADLKVASANRGRLLARLRAGFEVLDRQIGERLADPAGASPDAIRGALNGFAVTFAPNLSAIMDDERRTGGRIQEEMRRLRERLIVAASVSVALAVGLAFWLFRSLARPLAARIAEMGAMAAAIGRGELRTRLAVRRRDELGLAMAGFNRMAARLERREAGVAADRARLEQIIAARTEDLTRANERLAAVDATRRRFFTDVSHELRTPLTVILGECDLTLRRLEREPAAAPVEALQTIRNRAQRLHRRVEDLLRIARSDTGEIDLHRADVPVAAFVNEALDGVVQLAKRGGIRLESALPEDLQAAADREWMRQVTEGLVVNAVRHTPAGGTVRVEAAREGDAVVIRIGDTGSGIPTEDLPHVFDRFYRGRGSEAGSGFGIGLALAKWVVEKHGGTIMIASRTGEGSGTTVTVRIPASGVAAPAPGAEIPADPHAHEGKA